LTTVNVVSVCVVYKYGKGASVHENCASGMDKLQTEKINQTAVMFRYYE